MLRKWSIVHYILFFVRWLKLLIFSYAVRFYVFINFSLWRNENTPASLWCLQQFFMYLYYTNFSINFILYSMCGVTFRRCLWKLIYGKIQSVAKLRCFTWKLCSHTYKNIFYNLQILILLLFFESQWLL